MAVYKYGTQDPIGSYCIEVTRQPDAKGKMRIVKKVTKYLAPDTEAIIFYLTNYLPEEFKSKNYLNNHISGTLRTERHMDLSNLSDEELDQMENLILKVAEKIESEKE